MMCPVFRPLTSVHSTASGLFFKALNVRLQIVQNTFRADLYRILSSNLVDEARATELSFLENCIVLAVDVLSQYTHVTDNCQTAKNLIIHGHSRSLTVSS